MSGPLVCIVMVYFDDLEVLWLSLLDYPPLLLSQDVLEYKKKQRPQKIKMLDGAIKTILVDDSKTVGELLVTICSRIGAWPSQ